MSDIRVVSQQAFRDGRYNDAVESSASRSLAESQTDGAVPAVDWRGLDAPKNDKPPVRKRPADKKVTNV